MRKLFRSVYCSVRHGQTRGQVSTTVWGPTTKTTPPVTTTTPGKTVASSSPPSIIVVGDADRGRRTWVFIPDRLPPPTVTVSVKGPGPCFWVSRNFGSGEYLST